MSELDVQRRITHAFILTRPVTVVLTPRARVRQPSGGFVWQEQAPRAAQVMRLCDPSTTSQEMPTPISATDGIQRDIVFILLGEWDAEIGLYDVFTLDGHKWEVVQLAMNNGWEQRASVARHG